MASFASFGGLLTLCPYFFIWCLTIFFPEYVIQDKIVHPQIWFFLLQEWVWFYFILTFPFFTLNVKYSIISWQYCDLPGHCKHLFPCGLFYFYYCFVILGDLLCPLSCPHNALKLLTVKSLPIIIGLTRFSHSTKS